MDPKEFKVFSLILENTPLFDTRALNGDQNRKQNGLTSRGLRFQFRATRLQFTRFIFVAIGLSSLSLGVPTQKSQAAEPGAPGARPKPSMSRSSLSKPEVSLSLRDMLKLQTDGLDALDLSIQKAITESRGVRLQGSDKVGSRHGLNGLVDLLQKLADRREELILRQNFLNSLISRVESRWDGQALGGFLEKTFLEMAVADLTESTSIDRESLSGTKSPQRWKFYLYLSVAVREIPGPRDDLLAFLASYIEFSSMREAKSPTLYLDSTQYSNGVINQTARIPKKEDLGAAVEKRLKELGLTDGVIRAKRPTPAPAPTPSPGR